MSYAPAFLFPADPGWVRLYGLDTDQAIHAPKVNV